MSVKEINISEVIPDDKNFNKGTEYGGHLLEKSFEQFGAGRSILLDKNNRIIAGNKATEQYGAKGGEKVIVVETDGNTLVAVKRTDIDLDTKKGREMALADNATQKADLDWDDDILKAVAEEMDINLEDWGVEMRAGWGSDGIEAKSDMKQEVKVFFRKDFAFISSMKRSDEGQTLKEIKDNADNVQVFADGASDIINRLFNISNPVNWCIVCPPSRRHKENNFATNVCREISLDTGVEFIEEVFEAKNKGRVEPVFVMNKDIPKDNIILYDDILTTGQTIRACLQFLKDKNVVVIVGVNNN